MIFYLKFICLVNFIYFLTRCSSDADGTEAQNIENIEMEQLILVNDEVNQNTRVNNINKILCNYLNCRVLLIALIIIIGLILIVDIFVRTLFDLSILIFVVVILVLIIFILIFYIICGKNPLN